MEKFFQILDRRILGIFRTERKKAVMARRLDGVIMLDVAGKKITPEIVKMRQSVRCNRMVGKHGEAGFAQGTLQRNGCVISLIINGFNMHGLS